MGRKGRFRGVLWECPGAVSQSACRAGGPGGVVPSARGMGPVCLPSSLKGLGSQIWGPQARPRCRPGGPGDAPRARGW